MTRPTARRRRGAIHLAVVAVGVALAGPPAAGEGEPSLPPLGAWDGERLTVPRGLPSPWIPPSNPMTPAKVELGRRLFFERALSRDRSKSCADCHPPAGAFADGRRTALGVRGQVGTRNVPSLLNAAIYPALFWDGRAVSLEAQAEGPLLAPTELDMTEDLLVERIASDAAWPPLFERAFGSPTVTLRRVAWALACFQRTLLAADTPFDRWWFAQEEDAMGAAARRGWTVFRTKGACASCHTVSAAEAAFSDFEFHATGTVAEGSLDLGRFSVTGAEEDRGRFRTPTLRNVARTAPYFHDGSAATLGEVIDHYDRGGRRSAGRAPEIAPLRLSGEEKADLAAFLEALTSPTLDAPGAPTPRVPEVR